LDGQGTPVAAGQRGAVAVHRQRRIDSPRGLRPATGLMGVVAREAGAEAIAAGGQPAAQGVHGGVTAQGAVAQIHPATVLL
ncbi:hypothetical protein DF186_23080, partial [Enterococcus hirae]